MSFIFAKKKLSLKNIFGKSYFPSIYILKEFVFIYGLFLKEIYIFRQKSSYIVSNMYFKRDSLETNHCLDRNCRVFMTRQPGFWRIWLSIVIIFTSVCRSFTGDFNTSPMTPVTSNRPTSHHNVSTTEMMTTSTTVVSSPPPPPRPTKPTYTRPTTAATTTTVTTTMVTTTTAATPAEYFKVVCYFTNWAWYRYGKSSSITVRNVFSRENPRVYHKSRWKNC